MTRSIERVSSIEAEPRTLTLEQLQYARDAALCVMNTNTVEEAISIFTEGLKPVLTMKNNKKMEEDSGDDTVGELEYHPLVLNRLAEMRCDIASAPF